jgi:hypothetical protein
VTAFASEGVQTPEENIEEPTESKNEPTVDTPEGGESTTDKDYSKWIDSLTNSALWVSIGSYAAAAIAILAYVKKKFGTFADLIKGKADTETLTKALTSGVKDIKKEFSEEYEKINRELLQHQEKEKQMWAMLTIFMTHAKIPSAAKAEIMKCVTGLKDMTGELSEIIEEAEKAIERAEIDEKAMADKTPALDAITKEVETSKQDSIMELG